MILVVDDNFYIREILTLTLQKENYEVTTASNGEEALDLLKNNPHKFRLILLDLIMPVMDGNQLIELLENYEIKVPIIVMSGYIFELKEELRNKPVAILEKPFITRKIIAEIKKYL